MLANLPNCRPVDMLAHQSGFWLANLPTGLQICLPPYFLNCQLTFRPACQPANLCAFLLTYHPANLPSCRPSNLPLNIAKSYQLACLSAYLPTTYIPAYLSKCLPANLPTCQPAYLSTSLPAFNCT